jgi:hypothetical protein
MRTRRVIVILSALSLGAIVFDPACGCGANLTLLVTPGWGFMRRFISVAVFFSSLLLRVARITGSVAWITGMAQAALLLGAIGSLAYGLAKPETMSAGA